MYIYIYINIPEVGIGDTNPPVGTEFTINTISVNVCLLGFVLPTRCTVSLNENTEPIAKGFDIYT
jgi:hypothetical protein